jgi:glutathione S-transferase
MITLYGGFPTRATRAEWALRELGLEFEQVAEPDLDSAEFRALNPNGKVPTLVDGTVVWESLAVNLYLARRYGSGSLWPRDDALQTLVLQWSFWVVTELEETLLVVLRNRAMLPEDERDSSAADAAVEKATPALRVLDQSLEGRDYLVGDGFTIADLNVAAIVLFARIGGFDLSTMPNLTRWLDACISRPAAQGG